MTEVRADPSGARLRFAPPVDSLRGRRTTLRLLLVLSMLISGAAEAGARGPSRSFDSRIEHNRNFVSSEAARDTATPPTGASLTRDPITGAIRSMVNPTGYLTGPSPAGQDLSAAALAYLDSNLALLGLSKSDLEEIEVTDVVHSPLTGATRTYLRQRYRGLPVYGTQLQINQNRDGRILSINNSFMPNIRRAGSGRSSEPLLEADTCTASAGLHVGVESGFRPKISQRGRGPGRRTQIVWEGASPEPIAAQLMWLPIRESEMRLVWNLQFQTAGNQNFFDFTVDASSGKVWTRFDGNRRAQYRVYVQPNESPNHSTPPGPLDGRTLVIDPADPTASPAGWHFVGNTNMRGNNVDVYDDINSDDLPPELGNPPQAEPGCEADLTCDFPLDLNAAPANSVPAAVANAFYWTNTVHDIQYKYGFDEAAGNFQVDNFGRGGIGGDHVAVEIQDGGGNCDASFSTPADGASPKMQLFTCERLNSHRDGAFDTGVIVHEFTHGLSTRLVGGPSTVSCLNNLQQMGEGWSDYYALAYTARAGDLGPDPRTIGTYFFGQSVNGPGNRPRPYSTDPAINDFSYASINGLAPPHDLGSVWAQVLWQMNWTLIGAHGFDPDLANPVPGWAGNQRALFYVTEGIKNTGCSPTFTDSRDGIILAATDNFGGEDTCAIWQVFADFGLGTDAISGGPDSTTAVNGFSLPIACQVPGNAPPSITINSPVSGTSVPEGQPVNVAGSANDPEDGDLTTSLAWTSSVDGSIGSGGSFQVLLSAGTHTLTATVSDSVGVPASSSVSVTIVAPPPPEPENLPPTATITEPANRTRFRDVFAEFSGTASDPEEGDLSAKLIWTSNLDGVIGQGASIEASLSDGRHRITATVTDAGNLSDSDSLARIECKGSCIAPTPPSVVGCDGMLDSGLVDDVCGICGGNGSSCTGCDGVPNSGLTNDACGVCDGDGSSCAGCDGVPNSGIVDDACGVCGGDGSSCLGCDGVPNSGLIDDACGVCGGDGSSCAGCDGVPNSGLTNDACGVCGGDGSSCAGCDGVPNSGLVNDVCGVCGGDGSSCPGCDGVPNSGLIDDACGVCGGDSSSCAGCDGVPNSGLVNDVCGVCGGDSSSCPGCDGVPNSGLVDDACGVCGGDGSSCAGCDGVPNSGLINDVCGVCDGDGSSCLGCDGVPNSGLVDDACGVCGADGSSCAGCDGIPNSGLANDVCGVCGGDGSSCAGCDGLPNSGLANDVCGVCGGDGSSCAAPEPGPPQVAVTIGGPTLLNRGDNATFTVSVTNQGSTNLGGIELSFSVTPARRIKNQTPGGLVSLGNIPPGGSTNQTWSGRADKQGSATITVELTLAGVSLGVETRGLTIEK